MVPQPFLISLALALFWALLQQSFDTVTLLTGYALGAAIIYVISRTTDSPFFLSRFFAALELLAVFVKEVIVANIKVAYQVLHPGLPVTPGFMALPLQVKTEGQITLLALMITMTPGTLSVDVSPDRRYLIIHALDATDPKGTKAEIKETFERRILEVMS